MDVRRLSLSTAQGVDVTLAFANPVTPHDVEAIERAVQWLCAALRRTAHGPDAPGAGALEYDSWAIDARH